jgi:hypothetical protein
MMTPNMQGIIMSIGKARSVFEKLGPEAAFFKVHTSRSHFSFLFQSFIYSLTISLHASPQPSSHPFLPGISPSDLFELVVLFKSIFQKWDLRLI